MPSSKARYLSILARDLNATGQVPSSNLLLSDTGVSAGTYGSASLVPVLTIDTKGRVTTATTSNVAGVTSFGYNTGSGRLTINTADGASFIADVTLAPFSTTNLAEGANQYFTTTRARSSISATGSLSYNSSTGALTYTQDNTDTVSEGATNLYFTSTRARAALSATTGSAAYNNTSGVITIPGTSSHITEGSNLFYTDTRVRAALSGSTGVTYNSSTGAIAIGQAVGSSDSVTFNSVTVNGTLTSDDITSTNISVAGNATITGNLIVSGTTTTVNSTAVSIADINIELARNATTAAQANGAGITVTGPVTPATFTYTSSDDRWNLNKDLTVSNVYGNLTGAVTGNASTATTLQTTRSIVTTGDGTWTVSFDGSANVTNALTLATVNATVGTYGSSTLVPVITVNAKGLITSVTTSSISGALTFTGDVTGSGTTGASTALTITALAVTNAMLAGSIANAKLSNSSVTVTAGTGMSGGGAVSLGGSVTLTNAGVTALTTSSGLSTNTSATGAVSITNTGILSISGTAPVSASTVSGATTISMAAATSAANGYMTSTYAAKLDGIAAGATNVTNTNQLTNGSGYITGYTETDTLATVTGRGASTSSAVSLSGSVFAPVLYLSSHGDLNHVLKKNSDTFNGKSNGQQMRFYNYQNFYSSETSTSVLHLDSNSYIGMGTTSPLSKLHMTGSNSYAGAGLLLGSAGVASGYIWTTDNLYIKPNTTANTASGGVYIQDFAGGTQFSFETNGSYGTANSSWRAPIFYDSNDTGYYGDFASTSRFNLAKVNGVYDSSITRGVIPSGAVYTTSAVAPTGAFKIKLPDGSRLLYPMLSFTVELYNYSTGTSRSFRIGGHFSGASWYNVFAYCLTDYAGSVDVRFGYDAANAMCVWIGEVGSTWSYPQVFVTDFQNGYSAIQESWFSGWSITLVTAFDTVTNGPYTPAMGLNSKNYNSYSPTLNGTGASGTWGINVTGNAATASSVSATGATNLYSPNAASVVAADSAMPAQGNSLIHTLALGPSSNDGHIIGMTWANTTTSYGAQIWLDTDPTNQMAIRSRSAAGTWTAWAPVLTSVNYNSYSPTLTGGSASGTWGINISGNAATATTLQTNGAVSFTTDASGFHVINAEGNGGNVRLGAAWNRPGIYNGSGTTAGGAVNSITIGSENSIYFVTQNVERGRFDSNGIGYASASFRAPIFYDSDDTTYYANPNSFSQFSSLSCNGDFRTTFASGVGGSTFSSSHYSMGKDIANGSWSHPHYSDLIIGYHTGIRLGAAYSGVRFYANSPTTDANNDGNGDSGEALLMTVGGYVGNNGQDVNVNNILYAGASMRSPIFYDSDDTSYYTNPNSFSQMSYGNFNAAPSGRTLSLGGDQTDRVYNDSARASLVINAAYYPHLYINATTNNGNEQHGAVFSMTGNLSAGGYRRWAMGIANTNPDCFSWGYADNNTNPHYGVGGTFGYTGTPNIRMWLNTGGALMTSGDMRAPIFYDSNDTAYYLDPASTSRINRIDYTNLYYASNTNYGFVGPNVYADTINSGDAGDQLELCYYRGAFTSSSGSMRAPLFYDRDDTGYYTDPASTSVMNRISTVRTDNWLYIDNSYGHSVVGKYDSGVLQGVWAMGDSYKLTAAGGVGTLYGIAWSHPNAGATGGANNLASHGMLILENGTFKGAWGGGSFRTPGDIRGTIYYDYDNTNYYLDPNNTSNLATTVTGYMYFRSNRNTTSDSPPLQAYSNDNGGAIMSFHRGGQYAVNFGLDSDNVMRIGGWSASANRWQLDMSGNMYAAGNITAYSSDVRLKENIVTIDNALSKLHKIRGVYYDWKDIVDDLGFNPIDRHDIGVIAQEVGEVIPQAIKPAPFDTGCDGKSESGENYITVQMEKIIPLLIEAIKEQQIQIEELKTEMKAMKNKSSL